MAQVKGFNKENVSGYFYIVEKVVDENTHALCIFSVNSSILNMQSAYQPQFKSNRKNAKYGMKTSDRYTVQCKMRYQHYFVLYKHIGNIWASNDNFQVIKKYPLCVFVNHLEVYMKFLKVVTSIRVVCEVAESFPQSQNAVCPKWTQYTFKEFESCRDHFHLHSMPFNSFSYTFLIIFVGPDLPF
jgi:hypothetical protein